MHITSADFISSTQFFYPTFMNLLWRNCLLNRKISIIDFQTLFSYIVVTKWSMINKYVLYNFSENYINRWEMKRDMNGILEILAWNALKYWIS